MPTNLVKKLSDGYILYRVGMEEPKTTVLVSPDGENSELVSQSEFEHLTGMKPGSPIIIQAYDYTSEGRVGYRLRPKVDKALSQWVEVPLSGEMTICGNEAAENKDPRPEHQQQHVHLERLPA